MAEASKELQDDYLVAAESILKLGDAIPTEEESESHDEAVPELFLCPISRQIMSDPVRRNGRTFDRTSIKNLLEEGTKACPVTKEPLAHPHWIPHHQAWLLIYDWCRKHNKFLDLFGYSSSTPLYLRQWYFQLLHKKLLSERPEVQKEAAKEVLKETTEKSYFRQLYAETPGSIFTLLAPLLSPDIDPQIQEDLITTLMILSAKYMVQNEIAECPEVIRILVGALRSENIETQRNAAAAFFHISSDDFTSAILGARDVIIGATEVNAIIGATQVIVERAELFVEQTGAISLEEAREAVFNLCLIGFNSEIAMKKCVLGLMFEKIEDNESVESVLQTLAGLSRCEKLVEHMDKFECTHLLHLIREGLSDKGQENATVILLNVLRREGSKWIDMVKNEENLNGIVSNIAQNGNPPAMKNAEEILNVFKSLSLL